MTMTNRTTYTCGLWAGLLWLAWLQSSHFPPWVAFHSELIVFAAFFVLCGLVLIPFLSHHRVWEVSGSEVLIMAVLALVVLQAEVGITEYWGDAAVFGVYLIAMAFAVGAGRQLGGRPPVIQSLAWAMVLAGTCSTVLALLQSTLPEYQFTLVNPMPNWRRPGANLAQPNHLGTLLLWATAGAVYLHLSEKISKITLVLFGALFLLGVAMTESRTALMGVVAIAVWLLMAPAQKSLLHRCILSLCFAGLGGLLFFLWPGFLVGLQEGGVSNSYVEGAGVNTQAGTRLLVWPQLAAAVMERPWGGWGFHGVSAALNAVLDKYPSSEPFSYAHNLILELAIGFGIPVTLLLMGLAIAWCVPRIKHLRDLSDWYALALLMPFTLHSMLEFPFAYAYFLLPACFAIGMLDAGRWNAVVLRVPGKALWGLFAVWLLVGSMVVRDYFFAEEDFRVVRFEALKVGRTPEEYTRPHLWILDQLDAMNEAVRLVPAPGMTEESLNLLRRATRRFSSPAIQNRYALALALSGDVLEAQRQLTVMRAMYGHKAYEAIQEQWADLAETQYPQLRGVIPVP